MSQKLLLSAKEIDIILHRLACQLIENHTHFKNTVLIGIQARGTFLADRIKQILANEYQVQDINLGYLDITFYRDDFRRGEKPLEANKTDINFIVEDKRVVFIDDVLYTGRSIRAALTAIQSFGRLCFKRLVEHSNASFSLFHGKNNKFFYSCWIFFDCCHFVQT